ncbi:ATP-dependent DNA ligase LigD phosphoesterase module /ATP-dependent DNA ligase LigD polymerase module [Salinihabitans flavidus]|uniref:DNA ligase (ATP) n=1 Tax=Salinihabitans flavidus TaxID=569882 RepID=A0A1H8SB49_9RHOB|nr:DNA ligase D [Salinihabitans flavidus]SEO76299.1 ATP-dependent DNA ligase LigD phosphoesterase module /ATP-dependent DNA ligase LigD polymerase module [Salinihabitans flavidus]
MRSLEEYEKKRDFDATPEPRAELVEAGGDRLSFVVQKHDASRLHYDFRLEWGGVLLSWAVTKGPSTDPSQKRLAVRTEDHPVAYGAFEGTIPEDEYGGGTVMLWDTGWWEPLHDPEEGLKEGKLHLRLHGARMKGGWALVRMRAKAGEKRENWLLIKERDEFADSGADALTRKHRTSVTTGRAMREIAKGKAPAPTRHGKARPRFRKVQLATLKDAPPEGENWQHEAKFDGYRCVIALGKGGVRLYSRSGKDWSDRFGALCEPAAGIACDSALIDGEVIAGDGGGDFSTLQTALKSGDALTCYAFDCMALDGEDLTGKPLSERRKALEKLFRGLPPRGPIRLCPIIEGEGAATLAAMCDAGGEGIISKRLDAPYRGGRSKSWIKSKCVRRAEFVIAGWSPSTKRGRPFASLILGSYERGELVYRGRIGTGFDAEDFDTLQSALAPLARKSPPFGSDLPSEADGANWVTPKLVVEAEYTEFTSEGRIRHGVFKGLREDKEAKDVSAKAEAETDSESDEELEVGGVRISSAGRVVYPEAGLTKGGVAEHYARVGERMLTHAANRPLSLLRCPDGISGDCFFQKHAGKGFPDAVKTMPIEEKDGEVQDYMHVSTREGLIGAAQMGTIEFHIWGAVRDRIERPDRMVFDLDPDEGLDFRQVKAAAQQVREGLTACGLQSVPMVTGGKGVHVIVPLRRISDWNTVKYFARTFAQILADRDPDAFTATMSKSKRKGRVFIDWLRNERGATAIAPYSLRARPGAAVAVPVSWEELDDLARPDGFHPEDMNARLSLPCPLLTPEARGIGKSVVEGLEDWSKG